MSQVCAGRQTRVLSQHACLGVDRGKITQEHFEYERTLEMLCNLPFTYNLNIYIYSTEKNTAKEPTKKTYVYSQSLL